MRGADIDYEAAIGGPNVAQQHIREIERRLKEEKNAKDEDTLVSLQLENEMMLRGCEFLPIQLGRSRASKYVVEEGKVRLPFSSLRGVGEAAALALEQATLGGQEYISIEELQQASGVSSAVMESLRRVGALGDLPEMQESFREGGLEEEQLHLPEVQLSRAPRRPRAYRPDRRRGHFRGDLPGGHLLRPSQVS